MKLNLGFVKIKVSLNSGSIFAIFITKLKAYEEVYTPLAVSFPYCWKNTITNGLSLSI